MIDFRLNICLGLILLIFILTHGIAATLLTILFMAVCVVVVIGFMALYKKANPQ